MMFLKRLNIRESAIQIRNYKRKSRMNPGLDNRLQLIKEEQPVHENIKIDEETFDEFEQDISSSENLRSFHEREINKIQHKIKLKQIERKYFDKQKLPNMLLWSEKEQIRLLSQSEPDLWTPQKLSESFPATPGTIYKLLKSQWVPKDEGRIKSHDKKVCENWSAFEKGTLDLPDSIATHLKSFTSRKELALKQDPVLPQEKRLLQGEFANIIKSCTDKPAHNEESKNALYLNSVKRDSFIMGNKSFFKYRKECTLEEMKKAVREGKINDELSQILTKKENNYEESKITKGLLEEQTLNKSMDEVDKVIEVDKHFERDLRFKNEIMMQIKIPKEKWKKGYLYKINNCYYSDDGEFLYRI